MRYLGLDLGTRTLGLSISDRTGTIASVYDTLRFNEQEYDTLLEPLKEIVTKEEVSKIVLGLPKNMNNSLGFRAEEKDLYVRYYEEKIIDEDKIIEKWFNFLKTPIGV